MVASGLLLTAGEVRWVVGVTQRELAYWDEIGLVKPHGREASGTGSRRLYTLVDVVHLKIIKRLRQAGVSLQRIRASFQMLADLPDEPAPLVELQVLTDGSRILVERSDAGVVDATRPQFFLRLPIAELLGEVDEAVGLGMTSSSDALLGRLTPTHERNR